MISGRLAGEALVKMRASAAAEKANKEAFIALFPADVQGPISKHSRDRLGTALEKQGKVWLLEILTTIAWQETAEKAEGQGNLLQKTLDVVL